MPSPEPESPKREHRWLKPSVVEVLVIGGILASVVVFGCYQVSLLREEEEAADAIGRMGGAVEYEEVPRTAEPRDPVLPQWLLAFFGKRSRGRLTGVQLPPGANDEAMALLDRLRTVDGLYLTATRITADGLRSVWRRRGLRWLDLNSTPVTDADLAQLPRLRGLEILDLSNTAVTDEAVPWIVQLPWLVKLDLSDTYVTRQGVDRIKAGLPALAAEPERLSWRTAPSEEHRQAIVTLQQLGGLIVRQEPAHFAMMRGMALDSMFQPESVLPPSDDSREDRYHVQLTQTTPEATGQQLAALGKVRGVLWLRVFPGPNPGGEFAHADRLRSLPNVELLSLSGVKLRNEQWAELAVSPLASRLRILQILDSTLSDDDCAQIARMKAVRGLTIGGIPITDRGLAHLGTMADLEYLELYQTAITGTGLADLKRLSNLRSLRLFECKSVTRAGMSNISLLRRLKHLELTLTPISDDVLDSIAKLSGLEWLDLSGTDVTQSGLARLAPLKSLKQLRGLVGNADDRAAVSKMLPGVELP